MTSILDTHGFRAPTWDDVQAVARVIQQANIAEVGEADFHPSELEAEWREPRFDLAQRCTVAVQADGAIVGYAWFYDRRRHVDYDADISVVPGPDAGAIAAELLSRIERGIAADSQAAPAGARVLLYVPAGHGNETRKALLQESGYSPCRYFFRMERVLDAAPALPTLPQGITIRPCERGKDEPVFYDVLTEAFRTHFRHSPMEEPAWIDRHAGTNDFYRPELWFLAEEDGRAVGAVVNMFFDDLGWVDELGVRESARGRGIGEALLVRSFAAFHAAGQPRVALGVDGENATGATRLYERAGMRQTQRVDLYEKVMREGA